MNADMRLRVDQSELTLGELADIEDALGCSLATAFDRSTARAIAALVWVTRKRTVPDFTLADALTMRMDQLDIVTPDSSDGRGEAAGGTNGVSPPESPGSGNSTRST